MAAPTTSTLRDAYRTGALGHVFVEVYNGLTMAARLSVTELEVNSDRTAEVFRSMTVSLAGFEALIPEASELNYAGLYGDGTYGDGIYGDPINRQIRGLLIPGRTRLIAYHNVVTSAGNEGMLLGTYHVSTVGFAHTTSQGVTVNVTAYDTTRLMSLAGLEDDLHIAAGTNVKTAMTSLIQATTQNSGLTAPSTTHVTPKLDFIMDGSSNPLQYLKTLGWAAGWEISTDRNGYIVASAPKLPNVGTAVWECTEATLAGVNTYWDDATAVNNVVVLSQTPYEMPVRGVARMNSGQWGVSSIGLRTRYHTSEVVSGQTQANNMAMGLLRSHQGLTDTVELEMALTPHLDAGDLVDVTDETLQLEELTYLVERAVHNFSSCRTMLTVSRRLA